MDESSKLQAVDTIVSAVIDDVGAGPRELAGAFERLGLGEDEADRAADLVHRAHGESVRLRRREHEIAALFSSARELAEVRDADLLLDRLVNRAHEIMGCDVTYLSVLDPETRELRVRTTIGAVSPEFQHLLVPAGRGLVSEIVESRTARWVGRYGSYPPQRHEPTVDRAVEAEGLVSLLGVPMLTGDDVLGVLFVATRRESVFTPEQISVLSALADHASVVLQTADMLRHLRRSEDEARRALGRLTEHLAERDRANTVHQELVQAVLRGGGVGQIAKTLAAALSRTVTIVDADARVVADSAGTAANTTVALDRETAAAIERSRSSGLCAIVPGRPGRAGDAVAAVAAVTAGAEALGALILGPGDFELGPVDRRTVERAAQVCALVELQLKAVADTERRLQSGLVADILEAWRERGDDIARRARSFDVVPADLDTVHVFAVDGGARAAAERLLMRLLRGQGLVGECRGYVTAIVDSTRTTMDAGTLRERIAQHTAHPVLGVTAAPASSPAELGGRFTLAARTARLLEAIGVTGRSVSTDEYLPYASVFDADAATLTAFLDATIGAVRAYDDEKGTELLATLRAFVRCNASPTKTARLLRFHTNTVLQRLERIATILGADWRDDERLFRISLAVRLDELAHGLAGAGAGAGAGAAVSAGGRANHP
ncbi:helix-turn-helix domain-containing protein [Jiangella anatolica]|uniref:helix-turn-helix domain-containing protein n=1 Tax=Jiangella anatolica TaxID=2670374 RepID=UPI0018F36223|nr:helix-turn-helix domain-containing protein [Jiangella anatolica]